MATNRKPDIATEHRPAALLGIAAVAALLVAVLAHDVLTEGPLSAFDAPALTWFSTARNVLLDQLMAWASVSGGPSATSVYGTILIAAYLVRRRLAAALTVGATVYGAAALNVGLKHLVQRGRPVVADPLTTLSTFSFPSGHAAASTVFGGLVCLLVLHSRTTRWPATIVVILAISWVAVVCVSRAYLGLHFPTDIIAGVCEGVVWLLLVALAVDSLGIDLRWPSRRR